jgi:hypothetical protein
MRPSSTKRRDMISHSNESKLAAKSEPPRGRGAVEPLLTTIFLVLFDFQCDASPPLGFHRWDLHDGVACDLGY